MPAVILAGGLGTRVRPVYREDAEVFASYSRAAFHRLSAGLAEGRKCAESRALCWVFRGDGAIAPRRRREPGSAY